VLCDDLGVEALALQLVQSSSLDFRGNSNRIAVLLSVQLLLCGEERMQERAGMRDARVLERRLARGDYKSKN
jgi:hypothetical protein